MRMSVFGLGYVGAVSAACLARDGHRVVGVDPNQVKVDLINAGRAPVIEPDLGELIASGVEAGRLRATTDVEHAIAESEISLICVGTPSLLNGRLDLKYVRGVCEQIGHALRYRTDFHVVVARSTMLPGSMRQLVIPTLEEHSGKRSGIDFSVCNNPEFLREGSAVHDYYHPAKTVVGSTDARGADLLASVYEHLGAPLARTDVDTAEMVKYADNAWHALKVGFANEIGNICKAVNIDGHAVMDIFCRDTKLNLSPYYLKPGFAFGGSCLPKDLRALKYMAKALDVEVPIIDAILPSNQLQVQRGIDMITAKGCRKIGVLGFSFKAGTDDLRESPMVEVIERLIGKGYDLRIYDRNVNLRCLVGANRDYVLNHIPHISRLMAEGVDEVLDHAEVLVIGNGAEEFREAAKRVRVGQRVVDFVRVLPEGKGELDYEGICW